MQRVLVTGAAGFIGSHVVDRLLTLNCDVIGVDNLSKGNRLNLQLALTNSHFEFLEKELSYFRKGSLSKTKLDGVIHLAAAKIPRYGGRLNTVVNNIDGTEAALEIARQANCRFLFASTSDVYGKNPTVPFSETSDSVIGPSISARWSYAVSKLAGEHLCLGFAEKYGFPVIIVRYFGAYGPREHLGWWGGPQSAFIENLLDGKPIEVHGDGNQTRCLTYIDDIVEGTIKAFKNTSLKDEVVNLGSTEEVKIQDLAKKVCVMLDKDYRKEVKYISYSELTSRSYEDVRKRVPDLTKAESFLDYSPHTKLQEGLQKTIAWHKKLRG